MPTSPTQPTRPTWPARPGRSFIKTNNHAAKADQALNQAGPLPSWPFTRLTQQANRQVGHWIPSLNWQNRWKVHAGHSACWPITKLPFTKLPCTKLTKQVNRSCRQAPCRQAPCRQVPCRQAPCRQAPCRQAPWRLAPTCPFRRLAWPFTKLAMHLADKTSEQVMQASTMQASTNLAILKAGLALHQTGHAAG